MNGMDKSKALPLAVSYWFNKIIVISTRMQRVRQYIGKVNKTLITNHIFSATTFGTERCAVKWGGSAASSLSSGS